MSKVAAYYHIVFCTKRREMTIPSQYKEDVYRFIWRIISDAKCRLIRIGGIQNHVHVLVDLHPTMTLSGLVQSIKSLSSGWMRNDSRFRNFEGWAAGYYACSISPGDRLRIIEYIKSQELHHQSHHIDDEVRLLYRDADIDYDERDMR